MLVRLPNVRQSGLRNPGIFLLKSGIQNPWALEYGIQLKESGIFLMIRIRNPSSTEKESVIKHLESRI